MYLAACKCYCRIIHGIRCFKVVAKVYSDVRQDCLLNILWAALYQPGVEVVIVIGFGYCFLQFFVNVTVPL